MSPHVTFLRTTILLTNLGDDMLLNRNMSGLCMTLHV